jgi:hypothetical protein
MGRRRWRSCAVGGLLLAVVGCTMPEMLGLTSRPDPTYNGAQFATGDLEVVAQSTQGVLERMGIEAVNKPTGDRILIHCTTKKGTKFVLFLERFPQQDGMKTRIDLAWEGKPDEALRLELMTAILALHNH